MAGSELSRAKKKGGGLKWGLRVLQASEGRDLNEWDLRVLQAEEEGT